MDTLRVDVVWVSDNHGVDIRNAADTLRKIADKLEEHSLDFNQKFPLEVFERTAGRVGVARIIRDRR